MKKILLLLAILLIMPLAFARQSEFSKSNDLRIDLLRFSPSPITLGSTSTLNLEVINTGSETFKNLKFIANTHFPLSLTKENYIIIQELKPGESYKFSFEIKVSSSAEEGTYPFTLEFEEPNRPKISPITFDIPIKRVRRAIASTMVTTDPEHIPPGETALINIEIENNADFAMRDIEVKLNFSDAVPLAPYQTTSQKQIEIIEAKSSETVTFKVIALPDAEPNVYRLPLNIIFDDELGNENTRQDYIGIIISKTPEYDLTVEDSTLIKGVQEQVTLSISNIGPSNIKYLIMEVLPSKFYTLLSPPRTYIGHLEPDDYETVEFNFLPRKSGEIQIKVKLEYKDDLNKPVLEIKEVQAYVYSTTKAKAIGLLPSKTFRNIIFLLIIIFIYLTYKAWRSTRNLPSSMKQSSIKMLTVAANIVRQIRWGYIKRIPRKIRIFFIKLR